MGPESRPDEVDATVLPEHVAANRAFWDAYAPEWVAAGDRERARLMREQG